MANQDVRQVVEVCEDDAAKMRWLVGRLQELVDEGGWVAGRVRVCWWGGLRECIVVLSVHAVQPV